MYGADWRRLCSTSKSFLGDTSARVASHEVAPHLLSTGAVPVLLALGNQRHPALVRLAGDFAPAQWKHALTGMNAVPLYDYMM